MNTLPSYMVSELLEQTHRIEAFKIICDTLTRRGKYATPDHSDYFDNQIILFSHPFDDSNPIRYVEFVGSPGITASIGAFIYKIASHTYDEPTELIFWRLETENLSTTEDGLTIGYDIFAEVRFGDFDSYLVGGCTDYSGEGGSGYDMLTKVFAFLAEIHRIPIVYRVIEQDRATLAEAQIIAEVNRYWDGMAGVDGEAGV